ncbi:MAG: hypothetical protein CM1200mP41_39580 [Gammaproteobacteria bacterium]|nr:MAG: hypothetical protein CM1200mP41_39580 [Gammaproteobacteria bacterium]
MPTITLPDGVLACLRPVSVLEIANDIGAGLAGHLAGGRWPIGRCGLCGRPDCVLRIITDRDAEGLESSRDSARI